MATAMLEIGDLHVSYGQVDAVRGVSLSLRPGQIVSVIGPNGAGKTTLLGAAMGLLPSKGTLRFEGNDLHALDVEARVERGLCLVPEKRELFGELSVLDNLMLGSYTQRQRGGSPLRSRLDAVYARFPRLAERQAQRADTLSGGERQMLAIARALMTSPEIVVVDEPSVGLAPIVVDQVISTIRQLQELRNLTILMAEQSFFQAINVASRAYVLAQGRIIREFDGAETIDHDELRSAMLGVG